MLKDQQRFSSLFMMLVLFKVWVSDLRGGTPLAQAAQKSFVRRAAVQKSLHPADGHLGHSTSPLATRDHFLYSSLEQKEQSHLAKSL